MRKSTTSKRTQATTPRRASHKSRTDRFNQSHPARIRSRRRTEPGLSKSPNKMLVDREGELSASPIQQDFSGSPTARDIYAWAQGGETILVA